MTRPYPRLYHGTTEAAVSDILKNGIKPRGKKSGNWKHSIESNPNAVYLTDSYAIYFAGNATDLEKGERLAIIEIDTDRLKILSFAPDEDFLEQATRKKAGPHLAPIDKPMKYRTRWYRRRTQNYYIHWMDSLKHLGTCTYYGNIPPSAITRIAFIEPDAYFGLVIGAGIDPYITVENYSIMGAKYRNSVKKLFGDPLETDPHEVQLERIVDADLLKARRDTEATVWSHPGIKVNNIIWENTQPVLHEQVRLWAASQQSTDEID